MKTYCKHVDILDFGFIKACVLECLSNKWRRRDTCVMLSQYGGITKDEIRRLISADKKDELYWIIDRIALDIQKNIREETICLPPIRFCKRIDKCSGKERIIGTQSVIHQCYEYVAVNACKELFSKKIGVYQCASIPGRGQSYGRRAIEKWMVRDVEGTRHAAKMDIRKCYPSVDVTILKRMLERDLHKNRKLLYLLFALIDMYESGLSIGSHLSQWLCNYYLSHAYHYISERLFIRRNSKRTGEATNVRLISHVLFYMDDILIFGSNKKHIMKAVKLIQAYMRDSLNMVVKPDWRLFKVCYDGKDGKRHGSFVDMMGFRFYRGKTSIRQSIFLKLRRKMARFRKRLRRDASISKRMAQSIMSYWGWIMSTDSYVATRKYDIPHTVAIAKRFVSHYARAQNACAVA